MSAKRQRWRNDDTHCAKGHDLRAPGAIAYRVTGYPMCRACRREWMREYRKRHAEPKRTRKPGVRATAKAMEQADLDRYFAQMHAEENAPAWAKSKRMWPDDEGGLRRS